MKSLFLTALSLTLVTTAASSQSVHIVDAASRPGFDHTTIGSAIAAAQDGDLILVRGGSYPETVAINGKGLIIQAEKGASVLIGSLSIANTTADQFVGIRGIGNGATTFFPSRLTDNRGEIWIEEFSQAHNGSFKIVRCDAVVLRKVRLTKTGEIFAFPDARVAADHSNVAIYNSLIEANDGGCELTITQAPNGIEANASSVTVYGSTVRGGHGYTLGEPYCWNGPGGAGVRATSGSVIYNIDSRIRPGGDSYSGPPTPPYQLLGGSKVKTYPGRIAHAMSSSSPVREGATSSIFLKGDPGDLAFGALTLAPGVLLQSPNWTGPLALQPPPTFLSLGVVPSSGTSSVPFVVPSFAGASLVNSVYVQGLFLSPNEIAFSAPTQLHFLDPSVP